MDPDDLDPRELATSALHGRRRSWDLWQMVVGAGLAASIVWTRLSGLRRLPFRLQVPFVPSSTKQVENMMSLLEGRSGKLVDLGSGDGRIVVEAYRQGFRPVLGYELNPWLVCLSDIRAWRAGCYRKVRFCQEDFWKADLSDCSNVTVFLAPGLAPLLERKLLAELPEDACVVVARFPFLKWTPSSITGDGLERVWAYDIGAVRQAQRGKTGGSPAQEAKPPFPRRSGIQRLQPHFVLALDASLAPSMRTTALWGQFEQRLAGLLGDGGAAPAAFPRDILPAALAIQSLHAITTSAKIKALQFVQSATQSFFASKKKPKRHY
uniref:adenine nucleotide translocase lysine N-methyltransferase-like n=1 Tax=Euleptes europaea TaxID=460621 RepID=UPI002540A627|nr:adenine nucleotide translocase lysine N-methyltransferase-like [Euleptes europaea]